MLDELALARFCIALCQAYHLHRLKLQRNKVFH